MPTKKRHITNTTTMIAARLVILSSKTKKKVNLVRRGEIGEEATVAAAAVASATVEAGRTTRHREISTATQSKRDLLALLPPNPIIPLPTATIAGSPATATSNRHRDEKTPTTPKSTLGPNPIGKSGRNNDDDGTDDAVFGNNDNVIHNDFASKPRIFNLSFTARFAGPPDTRPTLRTVRVSGR